MFSCKNVSIVWAVVVNTVKCKLIFISGTVVLTILYIAIIIWVKMVCSLLCNSRGTKVEKMLTLAPERYTAEFCMVAKVILWCIWNHCIADSINLHKARAVNFLQEPSKNMSKYYFSKCQIFYQINQDRKILSLYNKTKLA